MSQECGRNESPLHFARLYCSLGSLLGLMLLLLLQEEEEKWSQRQKKTTQGLPF